MTALIVATSGAAIAAIPSGDGTINGCYNQRSGALRVIERDTQSCVASEAPISWKTGTNAAGGDLTGNYPNPRITTGAVTGAKVEDGSLTGDDINEATLGQVANSDLLDGMDSSEFGQPNAAISAAGETRQLDSSGQLTTLAEVDLAAGSYLLIGKTSVFNQSQDAAVECSVGVAGAGLDRSAARLPNGPEIYTMTVPVTIGGPRTARLVCLVADQSGSTVFASDSRIVALRVDTKEIQSGGAGSP